MSKTATKKRFRFTIHGGYEASDTAEASRILQKAIEGLPKEIKGIIHMELWGEYGDSPIWTSDVSC
jgi:hypothetical protein